MDHFLIACSLAWRAPPTDLQKKYTTDGLIGISNCQISSSEKPTSRCFCQKSVVWTRKTSSSSAICASITSWSARTPCVLRRSSTRGYSRYAKEGQWVRRVSDETHRPSVRHSAFTASAILLPQALSESHLRRTSIRALCPWILPASLPAL